MIVREGKVGCEAKVEDNGRGDRLLPVCMGGTAISGAFVTIVGCNNAAECVPRLACQAGYDNHAVVNSEGRVTEIEVVKSACEHPSPPSIARTSAIGPRLAFSPFSLVSGI